MSEDLKSLIKKVKTLKRAVKTAFGGSRMRFPQARKSLMRKIKK
jgi:hypothetical protein